MALTLFYKDSCNSAPPPNIPTILSALQTLESDRYSEIKHRFFQKEIVFFLKLIEKKRPTMGNIVVVGFQELRTLFGTSEQFVGHLCNDFLKL